MMQKCVLPNGHNLQHVLLDHIFSTSVSTINVTDTIFES